jgi:hypothetical protein
MVREVITLSEAILSFHIYGGRQIQHLWEYRQYHRKIGNRSFQSAILWTKNIEARSGMYKWSATAPSIGSAATGTPVKG